VIAPSTALIDRLLAEDVPYGDLTTHLLGIGDRAARIRFAARDEIVVAGVPVARELCRRVGAEITFSLDSGQRVGRGDPLLVAEGPAAGLHAAWKVCANVFESCCGIATRTRALVDAARSAAPGIGVFGTRKVFPGVKELAIEALEAGGALPHRLGLSETVLVFEQHTALLGGIEALVDAVPGLRRDACEKRVLAEVTRRDEALLLAAAGVDGLQFDKVPPSELAGIVAAVREVDQRIVLIAAGGITGTNAADYAATGVDGLASSWMYAGRPADIGVVIEPA